MFVGLSVPQTLKKDRINPTNIRELFIHQICGMVVGSSDKVGLPNEEVY
jgi:hypothetical protein